MPERYTHGHHESVLRSHAVRTAENSAAYLLPHLRPGLTLLDVGCGPGTITADLARCVAPAHVLGLDADQGVLNVAAAHAFKLGITNVSFERGDAYHLSHPDHTFDVVHAHQVLQHLADPVAALREMRRVLKPAGLLAVRDVDYASMLWAPPDAHLDKWLKLYHAIARRNGAEPDAGRLLLHWTQDAGFHDITVTGSTWTYAAQTSRDWWGSLWADRVTKSAFAGQALEYGLATPQELEGIAEAFTTWAAAPDGFWSMLHAEVLARP